MLRGKIKEQSLAIRSIIKIKEPKKQTYLLKELLKSIKKMMMDSQKKLNKYVSKKNELPSDTNLKETCSKVIENTAFLSELSLYFPDFIRKLFIQDINFKNLFTWAYNFSVHFEFYDVESSKIVNLAGQELEIISRAANFTNPYKLIPKSKEEIEREALEAIRKKQEKKKEMNAGKKKRVKSPSLTRSEL